MEHHYLDISQYPDSKRTILHEKDNNLDKEDNLDSLPEEAAVYAICGRVNGQVANTRHVGETKNLKRTIRECFNPNSGILSDCVREFVLSIKTKELIYEVASGLSEEQRVEKKNNWEKQFKPQCNEVLNKVY